ncbi:MAG: hypothetical protein VXW22_17230, partial [Pseudomonadota bacterium]|nr:hypothetical protein [Pseudomonadota bacterium]
MRIANFGHAAGEQVATLGQKADHFRIGLARLATLLARGADDIEPAQGFGNVVCVTAVGINNLANFLRRAAGLNPDIEVILTVRRRGVDKARPGIVGDVVASKELDVMREERVERVKRMGAKAERGLIQTSFAPMLSISPSLRTALYAVRRSKTML